MKKDPKSAKTSIRAGTVSSPARQAGRPDAPRRQKGDSTGSLATKQEGGVAAVDRALDILAAFKPTDKALTLAELAARTGFYKSTILRISQSLLRHNYLQRLDDGSYRIGADEATTAVVGTNAWLLWPGDHAWVDPETVTSLIEAHGGTLTLDTASGRGSTFRVSLPG